MLANKHRRLTKIIRLIVQQTKILSFLLLYDVTVLEEKNNNPAKYERDKRT